MLRSSVVFIDGERLESPRPDIRTFQRDTTVVVLGQEAGLDSAVDYGVRLLDDFCSVATLGKSGIYECFARGLLALSDPRDVAHAPFTT